MPRLSIIIPHRHNDQRLESTILSVLENRPHDCEIIVVHDGNYTDPYDLADELLFVEGEAHENCLQLINAGVMAACSPVVCTLLDGVTVNGDWAESPLELLLDTEVAAVSVAASIQGDCAYGIDARSLGNSGDLQSGRVELTRPKTSAGPQLSCGFYRRKVLLALGGWNARLELAVADIDLAWTFRALELACQTDSSVQVSVDAACRRSFANASMKQLAELAVAYGVSAGGATSAMSDLLRGCLSGQVSLAVAWSSGIMSGRANESVSARLELAKKQLEAQQQPMLKFYPEAATARPQRRAA